MNRSHTPTPFSPPTPSPTPRSQRFHHAFPVDPGSPSISSLSSSSLGLSFQSSPNHDHHSRSPLHAHLLIQTDEHERNRIRLERVIRQELGEISLDPTTSASAIQQLYGAHGSYSLEYGRAAPANDAAEESMMHGFTPSKSELHPTGRTPLRAGIAWDMSSRDVTIEGVDFVEERAGSAGEGRDREYEQEKSRLTCADETTVQHPGNLTKQLENLLHPPASGSQSHSRKSTSLRSALPRSFTAARPTTNTTNVSTMTTAAPSPFGAGSSSRRDFTSTSQYQPIPAGTTTVGEGEGGTVDGARLPDITGMTAAMASPEKVEPVHRGIGHRQTRLGREEEENILASLEQLEKRLSSLTKENESSRKRVSELEHELEHCKSEALHARREDALTIKEWEKRYAEMVEEKRALEALTQTLRSAISKLQSDLASQAALIEELRAARVEDAETLRKRDEEIELLRSEVRRLGSEVQGLWKTLEIRVREKEMRREEKKVRKEEEEKRRTVEVPKVTVREPSVEMEMERERAPTPVQEGGVDETAAQPGSSPLRVTANDSCAPAALDITSHSNHPSPFKPSRRAVSNPFPSSAPAPSPSADAGDNTQSASALPVQKFNKSLQATTSFFSPTRHHAARNHPSFTSAPAIPSNLNPNSTSTPGRPSTTTGENPPTRTPKSALKIPKSTITSAAAPPVEDENDDPASSPFPSIRGEKLEQLFWSLPARQQQRRRASAGPSPAPATEAETTTATALADLTGMTDGFVEGLVERMTAVKKDKERSGAGKGWETKVPPQTVLARVVRELEDDFGHHKTIYEELAAQYALMDSAAHPAKRRILAQHLHEVIDLLEKKADQISSLYQLLKFADRSVGPKEKEKEKEKERAREKKGAKARQGGGGVVI